MNSFGITHCADSVPKVSRLDPKSGEQENQGWLNDNKKPDVESLVGYTRNTTRPLHNVDTCPKDVMDEVFW